MRKNWVLVEKVIDVWTQSIIGQYCGQLKLPRWCLLLQTVARYQCTRHAEQLVSPHFLSAMTIVQTHVWNSQMIGQLACTLEQPLLLQSEQSIHSTLVSLVFTNPCAIRLWVAVTVHSSSRRERGKRTDPTNSFDNRTVKYSTELQWSTELMESYVTHVPPYSLSVYVKYSK